MGRKSELRLKIIELISLCGPLTRPELIRRTGVRAATVLEAVDELKRAGLLHEPGRSGVRTGRRAPELDIHPDRLWTVGIDFQEHDTTGVLIDGSGAIRASAAVDAVNRETLAACRNEIRSVVHQLHDAAGDRWNLVGGIALADPGLVDIGNGISVRSVNVPGWENSRTRDWLEAEYQCRAAVWPGVMAGTYAEYIRHIDDFTDRGIIYLSAGEGIGAGFMKSGRYVIGDSFQAMEIGHIILDSSGPLCRCGRRGCLEAFAGAAAIRRRISAVYAESGAAPPPKFSFESFIAAAETDPGIRQIADDVCECIGKALATAVTLLNPGVIVIGGRLAGLGRRLLGTIRRRLTADCFPAILSDLKLEFADPAREKTGRGAALMLRNRILLEEI